MKTVTQALTTLTDRWEIDFAAFMKKVDAALEALCGMGHSDLPDWMYADAFEDERDDFEEIAREVLEDAGYGSFI